MPVEMIVCVTQVLDPETPASAFRIDPEARRAVAPPGIPPVLNGFDENAVEAALRIKDEVGGNVTVLSLGDQFAMDVMKKPLSMGADELVLVQDDALADLDPSATAYALSEAIKKIGRFDLVLCGRQASDWDGAQVPQGVAEMLDLPCVTVAKRVEVVGNGLVVQRALPDGYQVVEAELPALVTVTNELGDPRYATLRGIMAAGKKTPTVWSAADLALETSRLQPKVRVTDLFVPVSERRCEFIEGEDEADAGRQLAIRLREASLI